MTWTPPKLVKWITEDFEEKGFPPPYRFQAELLVSHALNMSRLDIYLQHDKPCTAEEQKRVRELVKRRYRREPVAYITGSCDFWSLNLEVGPGVLIPRHETEILVETVLKNIPEHVAQQSIQILELGTGSAAIPLALCAERSNLQFVSTELSSQALVFARRNLDNHSHLVSAGGNNVLLIQADKFSSIRQQPIFDFIVSNPPYIPEDQIPTLQDEVSKWEPNLALAGGIQGMDFYKYLMQTAECYLKPGGFLIFEHGFDQADFLVEQSSRYHNKLKLLERHKDYAGHDRILVFTREDS